MQLLRENQGPNGPVAYGPYLEDRKGTEALLQRSVSKDGHLILVARHERTGALALIHRLTIDSEASADARQVVLNAARQALTFRHAAVLPLVEVMVVNSGLAFVQESSGTILLRDFLTRQGPMPQAEALYSFWQFADALRAAQAAGLTLSQISPQDFVVTYGSATGDDRQLHSLCPLVPNGWWLEVADPVFASPEQKQGALCDIRSSLYSTGATLANVLTGRRPAEGESWKTWLDKNAFQKEVKAALLAVLHDEPAQRCPDAAAWKELLEAAQRAAALLPSTKEAAPKAAAAPATEPDKVTGQALSSSVPSRLAPVRNVTSALPDASPIGKKSLLSSPLLWAGLCITLAIGAAAIWQAKQVSEPHVSNDLATAPPVLTSPIVAPAPLPIVVAPAKPPALVVAAKAPEIPPEAPPEPPAPSLASLSSIDPRPAPIAPAPMEIAETVRKAQLLSPEEALFEEARRAPPSRQMDLYRQILMTQPNHREALHGLVEHTLAVLPINKLLSRDLRQWLVTLDKAQDPLAPYARGRVLLQEAEAATNPRTITKALTQALEELKKCADHGYDRAWFLLLQGLVNLHNVQQQAGNDTQATETSRMLFEKIDALPITTPAADLRLLAQRLEQILAQRNSKGKPHPQAEFITQVMQRLHTVASTRGDRVSKTWLGLHGGDG